MHGNKLRFGGDGVLKGMLGEELGAETLMTIGGILGREGRVGLGGSHTPSGKLLVRAAAVGVAAAGGQALVHELECPVQGAWAARKEDLPVSLFVEAEPGEPVYLRFFDHRGLAPGREWQRGLEQLLAKGVKHRGERVGSLERLELSNRLWAEEIARQAAIRRGIPRHITVAVGTRSPADRAIRGALLALGCRVEERWRPGIPAFFGSRGGFSLSAQDETGNRIEPGQLLALLTLIEMENGGGTVAVPEEASAAVDLVAAGYRGTVLRLERDGEEARAEYAALPWLWSAPSAAVRICARMGTAAQKLTALMAKTPRFTARKREVPLSVRQDLVVEALAREANWTVRGEGLRVRTGDGWVYLAPLPRRAALKVVAEGPDLELAAELCDFYAGRAAEADRNLRVQQADKK